jgi:peptidoglycan/LPS O-acetylase OafA/YrhL
LLLFFKKEVLPSSEPIRALTAIRGIAAWWVVVFHFREALPLGTPGFIHRLSDAGYLAVDLFFILSGYVIALNYGNWFATGPFTMRRYGQFLARRLSRIYPLHLFMLVAFLTVPLATTLFSQQHSPGPLRLRYFGLSFLLMQNWGIDHGLAWNVPAWSISTEWFAYLAFPCLVMGSFRLTTTSLRSLVFMVALLALLDVWVATASPAGLGYSGQVFALLRCVLEFGVGIGIARLGNGRRQTPDERAAALGIALACFAIFALLPVPDFLIMPPGFAALVHGLSDEGGTAARLLRAAPLQWLGLVSYSTYLSHYLLKIWTKFILVRPSVPDGIPFAAYGLAVLLASALLYYSVERPGQRWLRQHVLQAPQ